MNICEILWIWFTCTQHLWYDLDSWIHIYYAQNLMIHFFLVTSIQMTWNSSPATLGQKTITSSAHQMAGWHVWCLLHIDWRKNPLINSVTKAHLQRYWTVKNILFTFALMMTSSNGNIFRVTDPLCGEFTGHWWISLHKGQWLGALIFSLICTWTNM